MADQLPYKDTTIHLCVHCGTKTTGKYCASCSTAEGRRKMDSENKLINVNFVCKVCDLKHYSVHVQKSSLQAKED